MPPENIPLTLSAMIIADSTASISTNHLAKCTCLVKSTEKINKNMHDFIISNSLASRIGDKILWENDMVSLGSLFQKPLNENVKVSSGAPFDNMSIDNTYLAKGNIRCTASLKECRIATDTLLALNCLISALGCSSTQCSLLNILTNVQINRCIHGLAYSTCKACKEKTHQIEVITSFWILDSGALLHFTGERNDFAMFERLPEPLPIHTANGFTLITGKGSVVLRHLNACNDTVTTRINNVFYCKDLTCQLLSFRAFLQDRFIVTGDKRFIRINTPDGTEFMIYVPRFLDNTIFVLQILDFIMQYPSTHLARTVNFDTIHKHFGHLSREVLRQARKHTRNFPYIEISTNNPICPGCVQGKITNCHFPPSNYCSTRPFQLIYSDLKTFSVISYYQQKYIITFYDNFTSYRWISILTTKDKAIQATKHFLAFVENQFHTAVQM